MTVDETSEYADLTPRAQARIDMIEQIKQVARQQLATDGTNLSLRAVARDLGVVSSAVYRYFDSRDALLTALIVDGYVSLADDVEAAEEAVARRDVLGRWLTVGRAVRGWALDHENEYALLYGSPVPGYEAPEDTIEPALRPIVVTLGILRDALERGTLDVPTDRLARAVRADLDGIRHELDVTDIPAPLLARALGVWTMLFGTVSFELFGHFANGIYDYDAYFEHQLRAMARELGLR